MSDPVREFKERYGGKQQAVQELDEDDPVALFKSQYGRPAVVEEEPDFEDEPEPPGGYPPALEEETPVALGGQPKTDQDALIGLRELLTREDITPQQRRRIERMIHRTLADRASEQDKADPLYKQFALSATQGALELPMLAAQTLSHIPVVGGLLKPVAEGIEEFSRGIEPTVGAPVGLTKLPFGLEFEGQAAAQALGAAGGTLLGAGPVFAGSSVVARGAGTALKTVAPRVAARSAAQIEALATRVLGHTKNAQLANLIRALPQELAAGTIFQGLTDPESLTTPQGVMLASLFGVLGAAGQGVRLTKLAEAEVKASKAKAFSEKATELDTAKKKVAEIEAKAADTRAENLARGVAHTAWKRADIETRSGMAPGWAQEELAKPWAQLSKEQKAELIAKSRVAASDSNLNKGMDTGTVEPPAEPKPAAEPATAPSPTELPSGVAEPARAAAPPSTPPPAGRPPKAPEPYIVRPGPGGSFFIVQGKKVVDVVKGNAKAAAARVKELEAGAEPRPPKAAESKPAAEPENLAEVGKAGGAIADNLHSMLYQKYLAGEVTEAGQPSLVLQVLNRIGKGISPERAREIANKVAKIRGRNLSTNERNTALKKLVADERSKLPKAPVAPAAPERVAGEVAPEAPAAAEAPRPLTPGEADARIAELQKMLEESRAAQGHAERRAHAAERAEQTDYTGVQSKKAWEAAKGRIAADPNQRIAMFDLKQFKAFNDTKGQTAGDELLREIGNVLNTALRQGEQAFRVGGDEFVVTSTAEGIESLVARITSQFPDRPVEGTPYTLGLRHAIESSFEGAESQLRNIKAGETAPKARVVEKTPEPKVSVTAETVPEPKVGEKPAKPKQEKKPKKKAGERTLKDVKADQEKLDQQLKDKKIDEPTYIYRSEKLKAEAKGLQAESVEPPTVVTRGQVDAAGVRSMTLEQLHAEEARLQAERVAAAGDPARTSEIGHDWHVVQREIRHKKPVETLSDEALGTHANELQSRWLQAPQEGKKPLEARMAEVDLELKKRKKPNIVDTINNERGSIYAAPDPLESQVTGLPPHSQRIQDQMIINIEGDKPFPSVKDLFRKLQNVYRHVVRGTQAADEATRQLGLEGARAVENPGIWAELLAGAAGRAQRKLVSGPFRINNEGNIVESGVRGLQQILAPFKGRINELRRYMLGQGTIRRAEVNRSTGIDVLDAVRETQNAAPEIVAASTEIGRFSGAVHDYFADSGMFSQAARQALKVMDDFFVPLHFYLEGGKAAEVAAGVARKLKIVDPLRTIVDRTRRYVAAADRNRLGTILADAAEANPELAQGLMWKDPKVASAIDPATISQAERVRRGVAEHGVKISKEVAMDIVTGLREKYIITKEPTIQVWRNGKREVWHVSPELAAMYKSFQPHEMHWITRMLGFVPNIAKVGITDNPGFAFINAVRDTWTASLQSKYGFRFGVDSWIGFMNSLKNTEMRKEYRAAAGTAGGITGRAVETTRGSLEAILPKTPLERATSLVLHPINALRELSIPFEEAARLGEYIRARGAGASAMDAAIASQRVTVNFRQRGLSMQGLNHVVIFLNPAIQSIDASVRAVRANPGRTALIGMGAITLPSVYLWAANRNDAQINELRKSRFGSGYWFYRKNDGGIGRIPKPFLMGAIFGTGIEDALDAMYDKDPTAGERFIESLVHQIPYNVVPTVMNMTLGLSVNRDFSTGGPIAPSRLETGDGEVEPWLQARPETGSTARALGQVLNYSPAKIEFIVRNTFGTLGRDVMWGIDRLNDAQDKYPAPVGADIPVINRFIARYPTQGAFNLRRFYDNAKKHEVVINTMRSLEKGGDPVALKKYMNENKIDIALAEVYADTRKDLAELRAATESFAVLPPEAMSPKVKRERIDAVVEKMIELARITNGVIDKVTPQLEAQMTARGER